MFTTQITSIESQRQAILSQIEELSRQEQALVQESLQYREMEDEVGSLLGAISSLKTKFSQHENASNALFAEISKLFQEPPTEPSPEPQPEEWENLVEDEEDEEPALLETATTQSYRYESATEIAAALADTEELDTHLTLIASILDSCPAIEIPGRVWFFVQNIPTEFDERILGYLPKSIRFEWDRQRTAYEDEMRASILSETVDSESSWLNLVEDEEFEEEEESEPALAGDQSSKQMEVLDAIKEAEAVEKSFEVDDLVQMSDGRVCRVQSVITSGAAKLATLTMPDGNIGSYHCNTLKYFGKFEQEFKKGDWVEIYNGEVLEVLRAAEVGGQLYIEVQHEGTRQAYRPTDLKRAAKPQGSTTKSKTKKASKTTSADILN